MLNSSTTQDPADAEKFRARIEDNPYSAILNTRETQTGIEEAVLPEHEKTREQQSDPHQFDLTQEGFLDPELFDQLKDEPRAVEIGAESLGMSIVEIRQAGQNIETLRLNFALAA